MGALFAPVDPSSDLVEAINRIVFRDSGATGYGQRIVWTEYDGIEIDPQGGATLSTGNPTLKIRQSTNGLGIQVRNAANSADTFSVQDSGVSIGTALAITGNATVGGTLGVTGTSTLAALNAQATSATTLSSSGLATLNSLAVTNGATVGGTLGVTGTITGSSTVQGTRLISTIATGTAPLTVASTTQVSNLNASQVVGRAPGTGVGDLAFYNASNRVGDSEQVDGKQPGTGAGDLAFYDGSGRVADSQLLDGVDGSGYSLSAHTHAYLSTSGGTISGSLVISNDLTVTSTINANGNVNLGNALADTVALNGTVTWADQSGAGLAFASPSSGYLKVTIGGTQYKVPYFT